MIRVLLAEDQTLVRRGISMLLSLTPDIRVVQEAADGEQALKLGLSETFDVALLDIRMPGLTGPEVVEQWLRAGVQLPSILLTTFDEDQLFMDAIRVGAQGFLLKDVSVERLSEAIRLVTQGETLFQPAITERVLRIVRQLGTQFETAQLPEELTPRERDVLRLIAAGYSNREIGLALKMSEGAVKNHASSVFGKLGARDRTRAVLRGIELGVL